MRKGKATLRKYIETTIQKQESWLRTAFLNELGEEFKEKPDTEIAKEAMKRGYVVTYDPSNTAQELKNKDGKVISTFELNYKIH